MYLVSFNYFRAITILWVVAGHGFGVVGVNLDSTWEVAIKNLLTGGTTPFLFISGFMFHYVFYKKYEFSPFMRNKAKNVLLPYLILGLVPVCLYVGTKNTGYGDYFLPHGSGVFHEYIVPGIKYLWTGRFLTAYWFVPFVMVIFLMSPLHIRFITAGNRVQVAVIAALSLVSVFIQRPIDNISVMQSVIYFTPVYLFGIWCSINRHKIYDFMRGKELFALAFAVSLAFLQAYVGGEGNYHSDPFSYNGVDLMYIQKMVLCLFFMAWLYRFEGTESGWLVNTLSSTSFAIFFIHPVINEIFRKLNFGFMGLDSWAVYLVFVAFVLALCVLLSLMAKRVIPAHSRYVIGY